MGNKKEKDIIYDKSELESRFDELLNDTGMEEYEANKYGENRVQKKYFLGDDDNVIKALREKLEASSANLEKVLEQEDNYFLSPHDHPSFITETVCFREERHDCSLEQDVVTHNEDDEYKLIYKAKTSEDDKLHRRTRLIKIISEDNDKSKTDDLAVTIISKFADFKDYKVIKGKRYVYRLETLSPEPIFVYIDMHVDIRNPGENSRRLGNFIEFESNDSVAVEKLKSILGVEGKPLNTPYIDTETMTEHSHGPTAKIIQSESKLNRWSKLNNYFPYYFTVKNGFIQDIDPGNLRNLNDKDREIILESVEDISRSFSSNNESERPKSVRGGTYEFFPRHDGFMTSRNIKDELKKIQLWRYRALGTNLNIVFSVFEFKDLLNANGTNKGIYIHQISNHSDYDKWLDNHRVR